jgi:hypothetical protein
VIIAVVGLAASMIAGAVATTPQEEMKARHPCPRAVRETLLTAYNSSQPASQITAISIGVNWGAWLASPGLNRAVNRTSFRVGRE